MGRERKLDKLVWFIYLAIFISFLSGCAGRSFVKPELNSLALGETTFKEVVGIAGEPLSVRKLTANGKEIIYIDYLYMPGSDIFLSSKIRAKEATFYFFEKRLVGYKFSSSFEQDSTDFDIRKANQIKKNKSTIRDVYSLLGEPSAKSIYPMTQNTNEYVVMYNYIGEEEYNKESRFRLKDLKIVYDGNGVITDVSSINRLY